MGTYEEITERMREASSTKNDSGLAKVLDITPQALSNYKKRGQMPASLVIKLAEKYGCSLDWLFKGGEEEAQEEKKTLELKIESLPGDTTLQEFGLIMMAQEFEVIKLTLPLKPTPAPYIVPEVLSEAQTPKEDLEGFEDIEKTAEGLEETH